MTPPPPNATASMPGAGARRGDAAWVLALAVALTMLNALRPVTVDDPAYLEQAARWAAQPLDPYGGEAPLHQSLVPAARTASAPVGIAWLALGTRLGGGAEWLLKLWLFPFAWLFAWALDRLLVLAAGPSARPWLVASVLSPAVLPSFGFMLEIPMLALAAASLAVFARAAGGAGWRSALAAGLLAGLALQAKYSAAPVLAALAAWGAASGRWRAGALAVASALATAAGIEALMLGVAGASPLLEYVSGRGARDPSGHAPLRTTWRLVTMAGTAAPALLPLGLTALGAPRRLVWAALAAIVLGFASLALAPGAIVAILDGVTRGRLVNFVNLSVGWMGPALIALGVVAAWRAWTAAPVAGSLPARALVAWLGAECVLAPLVSASASVRRVLGAVLALTLVLARLAGETLRREPARRAELAAGAAAAVALGLLFWGADVDSALAERRALDLALARIGAVPAGGEVAVVGDHWTAFQHEAARRGWRRLWIGRSAMRRGDWLVEPASIGGARVRLDRGRLVAVDSVPLPQRGPLTTRRAFYDGRVALRRVEPREVGARLWRVTADGEVLRPPPGLIGSRAPTSRSP